MTYLSVESDVALPNSLGIADVETRRLGEWEFLPFVNGGLDLFPSQRNFAPDCILSIFHIVWQSVVGEDFVVESLRVRETS